MIVRALSLQIMVCLSIVVISGLLTIGTVARGKITRNYQLFLE